MSKAQEVANQTDRPGAEHAMDEKPEYAKASYKGSGKLAGKVALITGGDSGIEEFGGLNILVNNAGEQHPQEKPEDITGAQWQRTFKTDIDAMFYLTQEALPHLQAGDSIINTASVVAYKGHPMLLDYSSAKGAIVAYTRSLSMMLASRGIRVNCVAPGPIWTPLIPSTFPPDKVEKFGKDTPLGRPGQPSEVAPAFVFLASDDASYITGQTIHINGGTIVNG